MNLNYKIFIAFLAIWGFIIDIYLIDKIAVLLTTKDTFTVFLGILSFSILVYLNLLYYKFITKKLIK